MPCDWTSDKNELLINSRFSLKEKEEILAMLSQSPPIRGHVWIATSGSTVSTSHIKWTALSKEAVLASAGAVNKIMESTASDRWVSPLPSFHVGGLGVFARSYLSRAKAIDYYELSRGKWDPRNFYQTLHNEQATLTSLVPAQLYDLTALQMPPPTSLRAIIIGGGVLHEELYLRGLKLGWNLFPSYGLTECSSQVATAELAHRTEGKMPPLKLLPHIEAAIDAGGHILLKSPALLSFYSIKTSEGIQFIDPKIQGWFKTEDLGDLSGRFLTVHGRTSNFIKIGGESVSLLRLERILNEVKLTHRSEIDMHLIPIPDRRLGHVIHAAVAASPGGSLNEIIASYQENVLPFERIRKVHYVERIPRSSLSKVLMHELVQLIKVSN
jgi:o-succinylbenzoate---CoA ligase